MIAAVFLSLLSSGKPLPTLEALGNSERGNEIGCGIVAGTPSPEDIRELSRSSEVESKRMEWSELRANQLTRKAMAKNPALVSSCEDMIELFHEASERADREAGRVYHTTGRQRAGFNEALLRGLQ